MSSAKVINLIVLGLDESGKTTMCLQVHNNLEKGTTPTTGLTKYAPLRVQGCDVILHDMGGADGCRKMWKSYFADVHGVVFVVDSTKKSLKTEIESFRETMKHPQVGQTRVDSCKQTRSSRRKICGSNQNGIGFKIML